MEDLNNTVFNVIKPKGVARVVWEELEVYVASAMEITNITRYKGDWF